MCVSLKFARSQNRIRDVAEFLLITSNVRSEDSYIGLADLFFMKSL